MLMILSPAKTLDLSINEYEIKTSELFFQNETRELVYILQKFTKDELGKLMKMSEKLADLNFERYKNFYNGGVKEYIALLGFKGEAYKGLNVEDFTLEDLEYSQRVLRVLSGLYGVIKPLDIIKEYRLEMGTKLNNSKGKDLYSFWRDKITSRIEEDLENSPGENVLINLASKEYSSSLNLDKIIEKNKVIEIIFLENKNGEYKLVGTYAKKARGIMARYIIKNRVKSLAEIKNFKEEGYLYNEELSNCEKFVFVR